MAEQTNIEWCDSTFNPWIGCTRVSLACDDCYAARSTPARTLGVAWGAGQPRRRTSDSTWDQPMAWQRQAAAFQAQHGRRRRVFCASLADVFDNEVPTEWRADLLATIGACEHLDWLLLTKRVGNVARLLREAAEFAHAHGMSAVAHWITAWVDGEPPPNVWLGATVVNQAEVDRDIPKLLSTPARVRFVSVEPMLGPIDLERPRPGPDLDQGGGRMICQPWLIQSGIDWVICGGESGPKARPMHPDWARSLRDQCAAAGVAFHFKQWGAHDLSFDRDRDDPDLGRCNSVARNPGRWINLAGGHGFSGERVHYARKVRDAGRLLDGREHNDWPR